MQENSLFSSGDTYERQALKKFEETIAAKQRDNKDRRSAGMKVMYLKRRKA